MYEEVRTKLQGKFELLQNYRAANDLAGLVSYMSDYKEYIGKSNELAIIIKNLSQENKISKELLQDIFNLFMHEAILQNLPLTGLVRPGTISKQSRTIKEETPEFPPFWDNVIDKKFNLVNDFLCYMNKYGSIASCNSQVIDSSKTEDDEEITYEMCIENDFISIQKLHKDILDKIGKKQDANKAEKDAESLYKLNEKGWTDVTIEFKNDYDVQIKIGGKKFQSDYEKLGFADERIKNTNDKTTVKTSWNLLTLLSTQGGIFSLDKLLKKDVAQCKKQKQEIVSIFKKKFGTAEDPFEKYSKHKKIYKMKLKLVPIEDFREDYYDKRIRKISQ